MSRRYRIYDGKAPVWLQKVGGLLLAPIAFLLGYRARYLSAANSVRALAT